jgi:hypothetical protein
VVTVKAASDPPLTDGNNNIDSFAGGTNENPATWTSPTGDNASVNTGYFGYTTNDTSLSSGTLNRFLGNKWAGLNNLTPEEIIYSAGPTSGAEITRIGWIAEVNPFQPAGNYSGTVILVATPTY